MSTVKFIYGNKAVLQERLYDQGTMMVSNDTSQIFFDLSVGGISERLTFSGIQYLQTQSDRFELTPLDIKDSLYFVISTCKFYYYYADQWKDLISSPIIQLTTSQRVSMTQCQQGKLYVDTNQQQIYYGINISGQVFWVQLSASDKISSYIGDVNLKVSSNNQEYNVLSNSGTNVIVGNDDSYLKLNGTIQYNNKNLNTANSLVVLDSYGKIPNNLLYANENPQYADVYFQEKMITVQNAFESGADGIISFTYADLGIDSSTLVQLLDDDLLVRDDLIPIYWDQYGLHLNFTPIQDVITENTDQFRIKYLVAQRFDILQPSNTTTIAELSFVPYNLPNNIKSFSWSQLGVSSPTMVQLVDDDGLIRDDVVPIYWTAQGLEMNFASISSSIGANEEWKILYVVTGKSGTYATTAYVDQKLGQVEQILDLILYGESSSSASSNSSQV